MTRVVRRRWKAAVAIATTTVLTACAPLPLRDLRDGRTAAVTSGLKTPPAPSAVGYAAQNATAAQRAGTAGRIWRTIADRYYDAKFNGVDLAAVRARSIGDARTAANDADFYRGLQRDVELLGDSHTAVLTPREVEEERTAQADRIGIEYDIVEGRVVITRVSPGFPAAAAGIRSGMIVAGVDGVALDAAFLAEAAARDARSDHPGERDVVEARQLRAVHELLSPEDGAIVTHRVDLLRADDTRWSATLRAQVHDVPESASFELLPSGVAVLRISAFEGELRKTIADRLDEARAHSRGLIVDLRGNPGGELDMFLWFVDQFIDRPVTVAAVVHRPGLWFADEKLVVEPAAHPYRSPIAILVDSSTASSAELVAHVLTEQRGAITVGEATCGCVVAIRGEYALPDGGALRVAEEGFVTARGRRMENDPLRPRMAVVPALADLRAGRDVVQEAAENALSVASEQRIGHETTRNDRQRGDGPG